MTDIATELASSHFPLPQHKVRILLVDDEASMHSLLGDFFDQRGISVTPAASRAQALGLLTSDPFDLVVLDLRLGWENGLDLLRDLRTGSDIPVIITTGQRRDEADRVVGLELGADDYLVKPFGLPELLARVRALLRRMEARAEAPKRKADGRHSR